MSLHTWMLFAAAYLATTISPGPNVLLVIRNTVRYGRKGTAPTIAGNLLAQLVVVMLVALGVGAVLAALPAVFIGMKVAGATYLIQPAAPDISEINIALAIVATDSRDTKPAFCAVSMCR